MIDAGFDGPGAAASAAGDVGHQVAGKGRGPQGTRATDYIDLLWLHAWDFTTSIEEVVRGLDDLVRQGKVLYDGKNPLIIPVLGARSEAHIQDNLDCLEFELSPGHLQRLEEANPVDLGFPHEFLASDSIRDIVFAGTFAQIDMRR